MTIYENWGVIFDVDGVLIDSYDAHFRSWKIMLNRHDTDITESQFAETFGQTNPTIFGHLFPHFDPADYDALGEEKEEAYREIIQQDFPEMPGAVDIITRLHEAGAKLAIGSSGPPANVKAVLDALPNGSLIAASVNGQEVAHGKPDPEVFLKAAARIDLPPHRCVVIEDAPVGVAAGKAAGCKTIALTGTATARQLAAADHIVDHLDSLAAKDIVDMLRE